MKSKFTLVALAISTMLVACNSNSGEAVVATTPGDTLVVTSNNRLVTFNRTNPGAVVSDSAVTGLGTTERIVGIDHRPRDNRVYLLTRDVQSNSGRLYTINPSTGAATPVGSGLGTPLQGESFGVDFNAQVDGLRVVSNTGQNLVVSPATGAVTVSATNLSQPNAGVATAYTNSFDATRAVRMFNLDTAANQLTRQGGAARAFNGGAIDTIAPLLDGNPTISNTASFDIDGFNNLGYAVMTVNGQRGFYEINIPFDATGTESPTSIPAPNAAVLLGSLAGVGDVVGMTLLPRGNSAPSVVALNNNPNNTQSLVTAPVRTPGEVRSTATITGLAAGESILSIDFRPFDRKIYGLTNQARVVTLDAATGVATPVVQLQITAGTAGAQAGQSLTDAIAAGKRIVIDFNTAVAAAATGDALRIIASTADGTSSNNYRIFGDRLAATGDNVGVINRQDVNLTVSGLTPAAFDLSAIAYANSFTRPARPAGAPARVVPAPRLIGADSSATNRLLELFSLPADPAQPNIAAGNYSGVKGLGATLAAGVAAKAGLDVFGGDNGLRVLAARQGTTGPFTLFNLDLEAGALQGEPLGTLGSGNTAPSNVVSIAITN